MKKTLVVETVAGVLIREVRPATSLLAREIHGDAVEDSVSRASEIWGLPDFVYGAIEIDKSSSRREVGDLFLIVEGVAAIVQIKGRPEPTDDLERERGWVKKQVARAHSQAVGTFRSLSQHPTELQNARGQKLQIEPDSYEWLKIVVIEHSAAPDVSEVDFALDGDSVVLYRSDWDFLFSELRSSTGVLQYLQRADGVAPGKHPEHFYKLAQVDEATAPGPPGFDAEDLGARIVSTPQMPLKPSGVDNGDREMILRIIIEDVALVGIAEGSLSERDRLMTLSSLDRFPLVHRADLCAWIPIAVGKVAEADRANPGSVTVASRSFVSPDGETPQFVVVVCAAPATAQLLSKFNDRTIARHMFFCNKLGTHDIRTVGILVSKPIESGGRLWDTTVALVQGELPLNPSERSRLLDSYPIQPHDFDA